MQEQKNRIKTSVAEKFPLVQEWISRHWMANPIPEGFRSVLKALNQVKPDLFRRSGVRLFLRNPISRRPGLIKADCPRQMEQWSLQPIRQNQNIKLIQLLPQVPFMKRVARTFA